MLAYILSQPRSGSTVLTAILDRRKGFVCPPESSFPQILGVISRKEREDPRRLAALYLGSTFPPTPLTIDDAEACMKGSNEEILIALGKALAFKLGRDPADVRKVVWKTTRTIGMHAGPLSTSGKFVVLRRHRHNVFESQFRFDFGAKNRKPFRYAVFLQSYEHALARCPADRTFLLDYEAIPAEFPNLMRFLGVEDLGEWETGVSSLKIVAENCSWLTEITGDFSNTDAEKRSRLDPRVIRQLEASMSITRPFRSLMGPIRAIFDRRSLGHIRHAAKLEFDGRGAERW